MDTVEKLLNHKKALEELVKIRKRELKKIDFGMSDCPEMKNEYKESLTVIEGLLGQFELKCKHSSEDLFR